MELERQYMVCNLGLKTSAGRSTEGGEPLVSQAAILNTKRNANSFFPGFERVSPCPFPMTITITLRLMDIASLEMETANRFQKQEESCMHFA